jgi:hypothetical protein
MIQALLDAVLDEFGTRGETAPHILATGGSAALLRQRLKTPFRPVPDLTLRGLAAAWDLNMQARTPRAFSAGDTAARAWRRHPSKSGSSLFSLSQNPLL